MTVPRALSKAHYPLSERLAMLSLCGNSALYRSYLTGQSTSEMLGSASHREAKQ